MHNATCKVDDCEIRAKVRGWCKKHYERFRKNGHTDSYYERTIRERLDEKISKQADGCWLFTGTKDPCGYGSIRDGRHFRGAHRVAYEQYVGPIPDGLSIDHLCRVRHCVNREHLEPVTHRENVLRSENHAARNARRNSCNAGHEYTADTMRILSSGERRCIVCAQNRSRNRLIRRSTDANLPDFRLKNVAYLRRVGAEVDRLIAERLGDAVYDADV